MKNNSKDVTIRDIIEVLKDIKCGEEFTSDSIAERLETVGHKISTKMTKLSKQGYICQIDRRGYHYQIIYVKKQQTEKI